jgi:hypothetical protein
VERKMQLTLVYFAAFMALGMALASLGPSIPDLRIQTNSTLATQSFVGAARAAGYLGGAGTSGPCPYLPSSSLSSHSLFSHRWSFSRQCSWKSSHGDIPGGSSGTAIKIESGSQRSPCCSLSFSVFFFFFLWILSFPAAKCCIQPSLYLLCSSHLHRCGDGIH